MEQIKQSQHKNYWLMKTDMPYDVNYLQKQDKQIMSWDGVRNYEARNNIKKMKKGDLALLYLSGVKQPRIQGIIQIAKEYYPDPTAFDKNSHYFDPKSDKFNPRWFCVDVKLVKQIKDEIQLDEIKKNQEKFPDLPLIKKGRLSCQYLEKYEFQQILLIKNDNLDQFKDIFDEYDNIIEDKSKQQDQISKKNQKNNDALLKNDEIIYQKDENIKNKLKVNKQDANEDFFQDYIYVKPEISKRKTRYSEKNQIKK
ncbi:PUA-like domain [Pseudocohnilembus persalinus]|uniref:PUA-like domain n=1 Tax=Pseudocohnilembus persalinus TaxID=266149 RepID=A0A0V0QR73_PSEPJ|nr:PUA-like domain [Pseudocohnilembus persalinus]|eukprot:KRX04647.1 PUA-like domain [Pseudocohnilembus persalinus]